MTPVYFSIRDIAENCRVSVKTAWKIVSQPDFPSRCYVYNGADPRWLHREVDQWIAGREKAGTPLWDESNDNRYTAIYRHFDRRGRLLYVGVSLRAITRITEHRKNCEWYRQIARVEIDWLPTRKEALAAEEKAILEERPLYNRARPSKKAA